MDYQFGYQQNEALRASFNSLTRETFGFDFESWYQQGFWQPGITTYTPHSLIENGRVIANVSTTRQTFSLDGKSYSCVQLGTVMTAADRRHEGLSRALMERVLTQDCDMFFLHANDSVLDFYPKFGFVRVQEYCYTRLAPEVQAAGTPRHADMDSAEDRARLMRLCAQGNPFCAVPMDFQPGLIMFYALSFMKQDVYFPDLPDTAVIAHYDGDTLMIYDVFCPADTHFDEVLESMLVPGVKRVEFGFTPYRITELLTAPLVEEDSTTFVLPRRANLFADYSIRLPVLSCT